MRAKESQTSRQFLVSEHALGPFSEEQQRGGFVKGPQATPQTQAHKWLRELQNSWQGCVLLAVLALVPVVLTGCAGLVSSSSTNPPSSPLNITNVQAASTTTSTSQIVWTTNVPADSAVAYGTRTSYGSTTPMDSTMVTSHQVTLSGLAPSTTYYYQVSSTDSKGNNGRSGGHSFKTSAGPSITTQPASQTVTAGQSASFSVAATGTAPLSYQWQKNGGVISGATSSSYTTPATTTSDNGSQFTVVVSNSAGSATSNPALLTVNSPASQLTAAPTSANFGNVVTGTSASQPVSLTNNGSAAITISQAIVSGTGFSITGLAIPTTIAANSSTTFNAVFAPTSAGAVTGALSVVSNASNSPLTMPLSGTGVAPSYLLGANPTTLGFGNVNVGGNSSLSATLTNSGNSNVTISSVTASGAGFSASGVSAGTTLTPNQSATLNLSFAPTATGSVTGSVTVASNAANSPAIITLTGTGVQLIAHSVDLTWTASTSVVTGYNVYRGTISGGPYTLLNTSQIVLTTYTDSTVQSGQTYFYVVTAVDSNNIESVFSNEVSAVIP
jgi:hypothetical protein